MADIVSIEGEVELVDGRLTLRIPRTAGGQTLAALAHGIGHFDGEVLSIIIQP